MMRRPGFEVDSPFLALKKKEKKGGKGGGEGGKGCAWHGIERV